MAGGQKDQESKQAIGPGVNEPSGTSTIDTGKAGMGPERNLGTSHGHANGVGEIYEQEGFGPNDALSEAAMDEAVMNQPVKGQPIKGASPNASGGSGKSAGGAGAGKGAQGQSGMGKGAQGQSGQGNRTSGKR